MSTPASTTALANSLVRCGDSEPADGDARVAHLVEPRGDQLGPDRLGVDLLHPAGGVAAPQAGDLLEQVGRVVVPRPEALEVEHAETAEPAEGDRGGRRHHRVHRGGQHRQVEPVGVDLPGGADLLGVAGAPRGHDRDVVEGVGATGALGSADLDLSHTVQPIGRAPPAPPGPSRAVARSPPCRATTPAPGPAPSARADAELDERLSDELDVVNAAATPGIDAAQELTVRITDDDGTLAAGISGWTWGVAAGIAHDLGARGRSGPPRLGSRLLTAFEAEALRRGCTHVFVTSFTFQAPGLLRAARVRRVRPVAGRAAGG